MRVLVADLAKDVHGALLVLELTAHAGVVAQSAVDFSETTQLVALVFVLALLEGREELFDEVGSLVQGLVSVCCDEDVQLFVLGVDGALAVTPSLAFLDRALSTDGDLGARLLLHLLLGEASGADDQTDKVVVGELLDGDEDLLGLPEHDRTVVDGRTKDGGDQEGLLHQQVSFSLKSFPLSHLSRVGSLSLAIVRRVRRWRAVIRVVEVELA
mmetsp:Transcript_38863/g.64685  ORF Transcript_38863/g.64685 Transcript_38863/m.64685 type:complete len:213 (+) Transcript_38863:495-1133(+)